MFGNIGSIPIAVAIIFFIYFLFKFWKMDYSMLSIEEVLLGKRWIIEYNMIIYDVELKTCLGQFLKGKKFEQAIYLPREGKLELFDKVEDENGYIFWIKSWK